MVLVLNNYNKDSCLEIVNWLIENGADVNYLDDSGNTCLYYLTSNQTSIDRLQDIKRCLLANGASIPVHHLALMDPDIRRWPVYMGIICLDEMYIYNSLELFFISDLWKYLYGV